jgi:hypothetical protein
MLKDEILRTLPAPKRKYAGIAAIVLHWHRLPFAIPHHGMLGTNIHAAAFNQKCIIRRKRGVIEVIREFDNLHLFTGLEMKRKRAGRAAEFFFLAVNQRDRAGLDVDRPAAYAADMHLGRGPSAQTDVNHPETDCQENSNSEGTAFPFHARPPSKPSLHHGARHKKMVIPPGEYLKLPHCGRR